MYDFAQDEILYSIFSIESRTVVAVYICFVNVGGSDG